MRFEDEVRKGVELLDAANPSWAEQVNLRELQLNDCTLCILGQVYGHYTSGKSVLNFNPSGNLDVDIAHGFTFGFSPYKNLEDWHDLGETWKAAIRKRLEVPSV